VTFEEMEQSLKGLRDNQVVQGQLLHRVEMNLDRLEDKVEQLADKLDRLEGVVEKLADGFVVLQSAMKGMVQSVEGLSATVDRFIRGMERNGHHPSGGDEPAGVH
jgi:predicted  nucleic acid-binding Zn-ribbon protein